MKQNQLELTLLFDYYGTLLTEKQQTCFDLYYNQDLSLQEIAEEEGISRQGVRDSLLRAETALRTMEEQTGCVARDRRCDAALKKVSEIAARLSRTDNETARQLAAELQSAVRSAADNNEETNNGI